MPIPQLTPVEVRVLACLLEKEITTPEYYPLSLNALVNACNQKSNRDPAMNLAEDEVYAALSMLREKGLSTTLSNSRVPKYGHRFTDKLNLGRRESAVICELMLRGPQTLGELRSRSERMHPFSDLEEVEAVIRHLTEEGMATRLERLPGTKETRHAHLFSGEPVISEVVAAVHHAGSHDRMGSLEAEVATLKERVQRLEEHLESFRRQFE